MLKTLASVVAKLKELGLESDAEYLNKFAKKKVEEKWIQGIVTPKEEGKFAKWCKANGFKGGVSQSCINKAVSKGGKAAKMALFAVNVSKGKYKYPKKD